ncbi:MAG: acetylornithine deacetylase [Alphaproteobacteria bacterium]|nr:acetylornithine deacetylase [Alphaproteobacteria bacterium]MCL2505809.1 acetylornithine deacetylase [Alphaproteobacteria bacterium]
MTNDIAEQAIEILEKLVSFDTTSDKPNLACINYIERYLEKHGVQSSIVYEDETHANLFATVGSDEMYPKSQSGIMFAGHTDCVPVSNQKWTSNPYELTKRDGKLYGKGAADMKGFIACVLAMVPHFLNAEDRTEKFFHVAFTSSEESTMYGAEALVNDLIAKNFKPRWTLVGEPTGFIAITQHRGVSVFETVVTGVAAHSSMPNSGANAIEVMNKVTNIILSVAKQRAENPYKNSQFKLPYTILNLGIIEGGAAPNIIADKCRLVWEIRPHPGDSDEDFLKEVKALIDRDILPDNEAKIETKQIEKAMPFTGNTVNKALEALRKVKKDLLEKTADAGTEAGIYQKLGEGVVVCGPGCVLNAHMADEFMEEPQMREFVSMLKKMLICNDLG